MRMTWATRATVAALCLGGALAVAGAALAGPEEDLAARYAPVVRLVEQPEECGPGEPYIPTDVDVLFDEPTVALRGPWNRTDLVKIGPEATDLDNRYEYHLDFPGDPLDAGCDYELWARRLTKSTQPTVYAHVATDPGYPGKLALQYWFFYPFNDFNNTHEGDWEMTQLVFDAADATEALTKDPVKVGYSSHEGAEGAAWGDEKLEIVDGTHPVVYPAAGSHANKFTAALYLGSSADAGVGCDNTVGPHRELMPVVKTIPSDPAAATAAFPWIAFEGRWGELQAAFFNGPTGPNMKDQWLHPIEWSQDWRDRGYAVPAGGVFGTGATDLFCNGVAKGSKALVLLLRSPGMTLLVLGGDPRPDRVRRRARDLAARGAAPARAPPLVGPDHLGVGRDVRPPPAALPRHRRAADPARRSRSRCCSGSCSAGRPRRHAHRPGRRHVRVPRARDRRDADAARPRARPGGDRLRARRDRRRPPDRPDRGLPDRAAATPPAAPLDRALRARLGRAHRDRVPDPGRDLARRALVPARARRRARGSQRPLGPAPQRQPRPRPLDPHRLARRRQRRASRSPPGRSSASC